MSRLQHLRTFLTIYREGSVSGAAPKLNLTQPAASQHLRLLETQLGQPLFQRLPRGLAPTGAAHALARLIAPHLDALDAALSATRTRARDLPGPLRLGGPAEFLHARVVPHLTPLLEAGLQLRVHCGLSDDLAEQVAAGHLDLMIATTRPDARLTSEPLFEERFLLVGAPRWAERLPGRALRSADLSEVPLLAYADDLPLLRRYWRVVFGARLESVPALVLPDLRGLRDAAVSGAGVTVLPEYLAGPAVQRGDLRVLHHVAEPPTNTLYLAWTEATFTARAAFVRDHLRNLVTLST